MKIAIFSYDTCLYSQIVGFHYFNYNVPISIMNNVICVINGFINCYF